ncbi:hypothetical protein M406DRAFT_352197 [Cryphonectria parasitica EP155]|uniref:Uncharacterized protein n=1 Tax=Cryphonectria parasitica (strain ATCC 38755 / EP155) TaxID=660469 RepID=A0A9P5CL93_CRYP1|nr:uncharacterized protein M406DRAFT_352197 [Cryphonectria parasitica EP155]KAF3763084.1 hypothetical protein M406DRAFT_352197 [Cryphonectria parasitica EP155]
MSPSMHLLSLSSVNRSLIAIVKAPRLHDATQPTQSKRPRPRAKRHYLSRPPTDSLKQRLQIRGDDLTWENWGKSQAVARSQNPRLPVLTHQYVLKEDEARLKTSISELLDDPDNLRARLRRLAHKGLDESDLAHWVWILDAEDSDTKIDRFVGNDRFKPIFVLMAILRSDEHFLKGSSLVKLYDYIARTYFRPDVKFQTRIFQGALSRTLDDPFNMTPTHFMLLIERLVGHCLDTFPSSIVMISRLVVGYIQTLLDDTVPKKATRRTAYGDRCMVFNFALQTFRRTPASSPVAHSLHSWEAQRILLGFSAELKRPLIIDRGSYRAIRIVLLGLKKTQAEKMTAARHVKTWPPYVRHLDGLDEARSEEEYLGRSVKAGILKRSEGYPDDLVDKALDTLGGAAPGQSVSIQQRSGSPRLWPSDLSSLNVFTEWAAAVKATRNAHEAWQRFHEPPQHGMKPNFQVYAEMFSKIFSAEIEYMSSILPGEAKETYPACEVNLTDFERERLRPCSPEELYEKMLRDGNRPARHCLTLLIRNAPSLERAAQFLSDAALDRKAVTDLTKALTPLHENLQRIPVAAFDAYLGLLCRLQSRRRWVDDPEHRRRPEVVMKHECVNRAVKLLCARMGPGRKRAALPWHTVMMTLANTKLVLRPYVTQVEDDIQALGMMMQLFRTYRESQALHPIPFNCLARCILKVLRHKGPTTDLKTAPGREEIESALGVLKSTFAELIARVQAPEGSQMMTSDLPTLYHELSAAHIQMYLEVLMRVGDVDEGRRVVEWALSSWEMGEVLQNARDPGHKQWGMLMQAFACFRAFTDETFDVETAKAMERRFQELVERGGTWTWPSEEDVEQYRNYKNVQDEML